MRSPIKGLSSRLQKISLRIFLTHFQPLATPFDMILASFRPPAHPPFRDSDEEEENSYAVSERSPCQIAAQTAALPSRQSAHLCRETAPYPSAHHLSAIKCATPFIVGYTGATTGADNNFVTIPFNAIGFNTSDIQQIKISDGGAGGIGWGGESFAIWEGLPTVVTGSGFVYYDPSMDAAGKATDYFWGDGEGNKATFPIAPGQGVVVNCAADLTIQIDPPYSL